MAKGGLNEFMFVFQRNCLVGIPKHFLSMSDEEMCVALGRASMMFFNTVYLPKSLEAVPDFFRKYMESEKTILKAATTAKSIG